MRSSGSGVDRILKDLKASKTTVLDEMRRHCLYPSPHARAASAVTADEVIDKIFGTTSEMEEDSPSQSKRCTQMWEEQRSRLMGDVDSVRAAVLLENASVIGRQWIN